MIVMFNALTHVQVSFLELWKCAFVWFIVSGVMKYLKKIGRLTYNIISYWVNETVIPKITDKSKA